MTTSTFDVIVLGVGGIGSSACWHLARRGQKVLGLEQFDLGHALASSHGESRLIRQAYFERPDYVPLLRRAYELWDEVEARTRTKLFHKNGLLIVGPDVARSIVHGVKLSAELHGIPIDAMTGAEAQRRFPWFTVPAGREAVFEPGAGYLEVEACVRAHAQLAIGAGATIKTQEPAIALEASAHGVKVKTVNGTYEAGQLVITAGPWSARFLPRLETKLAVRRVPLFWFAADGQMHAEAGAPCFGFELEQGFFYGVPAISPRGVKVGLHVPGDVVTNPASLDRSVHQSELAVVRGFVARCLPHVTQTLVHHAACMYTMTPDEDFIVDRTGRVSFFAGSSGHGFKFASVMGEVLADLALDGQTRHSVEFLRQRWTS